MKRPANIITTIMLMLSIAACSTTRPTPRTLTIPSPAGPTGAEIRAALAQPDPERRISALRELREQGDQTRQLDLQTLITFQSLEIVPSTSQVRENFHSEATTLAGLVRSLPLHRIPEDTAVLLYLAGQKTGDLLSGPMATRVDRLCGSDTSHVGALEGENLRSMAVRHAHSELAASCRHYLDGELAGSAITLSSALKYELSGRTKIIPGGIAPSTAAPWEIFKTRLSNETGIRLDASATRLLN